jgi:4-amino-4-deoxy-L-arabinose transferase-like glycosyltransferase
MAYRVFVTYATPRGPLPISPDVVLGAIGALILSGRAWRELRQGRAGPRLLFLFWTLAFYGVITANLGFDSAHYYAPLVTANVICSGVAIGEAVAVVLAVTRRRWPVRPDDQNTQIPAA